MRGFVFKLSAIAIVVSLSAQGRVACGEDQPVEFLHAMQKAGMGETAQEYLDFLQKKGLPPALKDTLDLELANCWRAAASEAVAPEETKKRLAKSQEYLDKFLKEKPNHPEVAGALQSAGNFDFQRGLELLSAAKGAEKSEQENLAGESRKAFDSARTRLKAAAAFFDKQIGDIEADMAKNPAKAAPVARPKARTVNQRALDPRIKQLNDAIYNWLEAQGTLGYLEFQAAQTYLDPKAKERTVLLQTAAKEFYKVKEFSQKKAIGNLPPVMLAKLWEARTQIELDKVPLALEILEECGVEESSLGKLQPRGDVPFEFNYAAQVALATVLAQNQFKGEESAIATAKAWRDEHKDSKELGNWQRIPGYQGITIEMAKAKVVLAEKDPDKAKGKAGLKEALALVQEMSRFPSEYTAEALKLKASISGKLAGAGGGGKEVALLDPTTFTDALALARDAAQNKQWENAVAYFEKAAKLSDKEKDLELVAKAKQELNLARYYLLEQEYSTAAAATKDPNQADKINEVLAKANALSLSQERTNPVAANAASLAVGCALWLYQKVDKTKEAEAGDTVLKMAQNVIDKWPNSSGGGKCAMYIASINIKRNKYDEAAKTLEGVRDTSPMYGDAMKLAANLHWQTYATERNKPAADRNEKLLKTERDAVISDVTAGIKGFESLAKAKEMEQQITELKLLQTKAYLDSTDAADQARALATIKPLADRIKPGQQLDKTSLDIAVWAVRVYVKSENFPDAAKIGQLLLDTGTDDQATNNTLVAFVQQVNEEVKKARTACSEAQLNPDPKVLQAALARQARNEELSKNLLGTLSRRSNLNENQKLYLADLCSEVGLLPEASKLYDNVLGDVIKSDGKTGKKTISVRAKLVGLLRQQKKFDEAYKEIKELLETVPAMEPLMEKGRILQAWAEDDLKTANSAARRFEPAANYWGNTSNKLGNMKPRPNQEYFEAIYNWGFCLLQQAKVARGDKAKADEASKLLNNAIVRSPALNGPEMVAKYNALIAECNKAAGIAPPAPANAPK